MKVVEAVNLLVETANLLDSYSEIEKANALTKLAQDISDEWEGGANFAKPYHGDEFLETEEEERYNSKQDDDYEDAIINFHENLQDALLTSTDFNEFENKVGDILISNYIALLDIDDVKRTIDNAKETFLQSHPEELGDKVKNVSFGDDLKRYLQDLDVNVVDVQEQVTDDDNNPFRNE